MDMTTSAPRTASAAEPAARAPASARPWTAAGTRSNTVSEWPALIRLCAMGAPMLPRPMNAMLRMCSLRGWSWEWWLASRRAGQPGHARRRARGRDGSVFRGAQVGQWMRLAGGPGRLEVALHPGFVSLFEGGRIPSGLLVFVDE